MDAQVIVRTAERRIGRELQGMDLRGGDRKSKSKSHDVTLKGLGLNRMQSARFQAAARMPDEEFDAIS